MSSYLYMKILESQPRRYDKGIALLSLGQSEKLRARLVDENIKSGIRVLDIGCGTGSLAILAAQAGAIVTGFDVSKAMLDVAGKKIPESGLSGKVQLMEMGISAMDKFPDNDFDLVTSTLVFSELTPAEQTYALRHAYRVLKPNGRLVIADEVKPRKFGARLLYNLVRIPMLLVTFLLTQTTTKAVEGLPDNISRAGFRIILEERVSLDSFIYIIANKEASQ